MQSYIEPLSERELEVLHWLASGASNREISRQLTIQENTVKRHVYNIFGKLNVHNRITTPDVKIEGYSSAAQLKSGILIGYWDEAEVEEARRKLGL